MSEAGSERWRHAGRYAGGGYAVTVRQAGMHGAGRQAGEACREVGRQGCREAGARF